MSYLGLHTEQRRAQSDWPHHRHAGLEWSNLKSTLEVAGRQQERAEASLCRSIKPSSRQGHLRSGWRCPVVGNKSKGFFFFSLRGFFFFFFFNKIIAWFLRGFLNRDITSSYCCFCRLKWSFSRWDYDCVTSLCVVSQYGLFITRILWALGWKTHTDHSLHSFYVLLRTHTVSWPSSLLPVCALWLRFESSVKLPNPQQTNGRARHKHPRGQKPNGKQRKERNG